MITDSVLQMLVYIVPKSLRGDAKYPQRDPARMPIIVISSLMSAM